MTASTPIRQPLVSHNRRRLRVNPLIIDPLQDTLKLKKPSFVHRSDESEDTSSSIAATTPLQAQEVDRECSEKRVFRTEWETSDPQLDSMWTLKRANPVADSDDDEFHEMYESPSKRSRKTLELFDSLLREGEPFVIKNVVSFE